MAYDWITVLGIAFIFIMNTLGASSVFFFKKGISEHAKSIFFGFAGGVMIAASVWSLLLPAIHQTQEGGALAFLIVPLGCLLGGICLQILDGLTKGLQFSKNINKNPMDNVGLRARRKLFLAVTLHNVPEGLAVGFAFGAANVTGNFAGYLSALGLALGIGIQNLPEGAAVALPMLKDGKNVRQAFGYGFISGAVEPFFAIIGYYLSSVLITLQPWLLAISAGAMLFVTVEELLPMIDKEGGVTAGAWSFMLGFILMMGLDVLLG
ncbi:MAG: ZIP family metal transporter [Clostridia bacterium]|nr:ZIP family metal transporter [Clostridia bacterium]